MTKKFEFLHNEIWLLVFSGAFQRTGIYPKSFKVKDKIIYRSKIRKFIETIVAKKYNNRVNGNTHLKNIKSVRNYSRRLQVNKKRVNYNFGVAQKLLNLYLKYLWCLGESKYTPPHFPIDRRIQQKLNAVSREINRQVNKKPIAIRKVEAWTGFSSEKEYLNIIEQAQQIINSCSDYTHYSLAELELELFSRRNKI